MRLLLPALLVACTGSKSVPTPHGQSAGEDTGASTDTDTRLEEVPPADTGARPLGLCHLVLSCDQDIPDGTRIDCALSVTDGQGTTEYDGRAGVEIRGRSSASAPKHQYSVELRDEEGAEVKADLLGMGADSDWILHGNYYDRSLVRNTLGFDLFRVMGANLADPNERWAPESAFCDLTLDDEWVGVYSLVERIKRSKARLPLPEDDGQGSTFVLELRESDTIYTNTFAHGGWGLVYPKSEAATAVQVDGITTALSTWETATLGEDPFNDKSGVFSVIDLDAAVDLVLFEEFIKNNDAWYLSLSIWADPDRQVHWVPWDLDLSMGQPSYNDNESTDSWIAYRPDMIAVLGQSDEFRARLASRWAELRQGPLRTDRVLGCIDTYQAVMGDAIERNFEVWPIEEVDFGGYLYEVHTYEEEDAYVRAWLEARLTWMDGAVDTW